MDLPLFLAFAAKDLLTAAERGFLLRVAFRLVGVFRFLTAIGCPLSPEAIKPLFYVSSSYGCIYF
jgi:hypothetical protein